MNGDIFTVKPHLGVQSEFLNTMGDVYTGMNPETMNKSQCQMVSLQQKSLKRPNKLYKPLMQTPVNMPIHLRLGGMV